MDPGQRVELIRESLVNLTSGALLTGSLLVSSGLLGPLPPAAAAAASAIGAIAGNWLATSTFDRFNELCAGFAGRPVEHPVLWKALGRAYGEALGEIEAELLQTAERDGWGQEHLAAIKRIVQLFRADVERLWEGLSADPRRAASAVALAATARELLDRVTDPEHSPLQQAWRDRVTVYLATLEEGEVQPGLHNRYLVALISQTLPVRLTASFMRVLETDREAFQAFSLFLQTNVRQTIEELHAEHARIDQRLDTLDERLQALVARGSAPPELFEPFTVLLRDVLCAALDPVSAQLSDLVAQSTATRVDIGLLHNDVIEQTTVIRQGIGLLIERDPRTSPPAGQPPPAPALDPRHKLFGRDEALDLALDGLRSGETVLVHGMPGVGKTALATEVAYRLLAEPHLAPPVLWVPDLGAVDLEGLCNAIATQFGDTRVREMDLASKKVATRVLLDGHRVTLVLDNLALATTAMEFRTSACPAGLPVLITSQDRAVQHAADVTIELRMLDPRETPDAAVLLFRDRANLPADEDGSIVGIAQLLGYHPLALVIAASQILVSKVQVKDLAKSLEDSDERLRLGEEDPVRMDGNRHRSVRLALQVAWDALDEKSRHVLARLAICPAAMTGLPFLALVCGLSETQCERRVGALVRRSLTTRLGDRVGLHELVRDFGRGILGDQRPREERAFVAAARSYAHRFAGNTSEGHTAVVAEVENLVNAAELGQRQAEWEAVLDLATTIVCQSRALYMRGFWQQTAKLGEVGIEAALHLDNVPVRAKLTWATAEALRLLGNREAALASYEIALVLFEGLHDRQGQANTLGGLAELERMLDNHVEARARYTAALALYLAEGNVVGQANALRGVGELERVLGNYEAARGNYAAAQALYESVGDYGGQASTLLGLAELNRLLSNHMEARTYYEEALSFSAKIEYLPGRAHALRGLGDLDSAVGNHMAARAHYETAQPLFEAMGDRGGKANALLGLGSLEHALGNRDGARAHYEGAARLYESIGDRLGTANTLFGLGDLERELDNRTAASDQYAMALHLFETVGDRLGQADTLVRLGELHRGIGKLEAARVHYTMALSLYIAEGSPLRQASALRSLGDLERGQGDFDAARAHYKLALSLFETGDDRLGQANSLRGLGDLETGFGECGLARDYYGKSLPLYEGLENPREKLDCLIGFARLDALAGNDDAADGYYRAAFALAKQVGFATHPVVQTWREEYTGWTLRQRLETPD